MAKYHTLTHIFYRKHGKQYYTRHEMLINAHHASQTNGLRKFCGICRNCKCIIDEGAPGCWEVGCDIGSNNRTEEGTIIEMVCKYFKRDVKKDKLYRTDRSAYFKEMQKRSEV